jgi:hypothetical protein
MKLEKLKFPFEKGRYNKGMETSKGVSKNKGL